MSVSDFNNLVNSQLSVFRTNQVASNLLKLTLIMYGAYAAPKISPKYTPYLSNVYVRVAVMSLAIWTVSYDVGLAVLISIAFILTMKHLVANAVDGVKKTGKVSPEMQLLVDGGIGLIPAPIGTRVGKQYAQMPDIYYPEQAIVQPSSTKSDGDVPVSSKSKKSPEAFIPDDVMMLASAEP